MTEALNALVRPLSIFTSSAKQHKGFTQPTQPTPQHSPLNMSPLEDNVDAHLKSAIQTLFEIQLCISSYAGPQTAIILTQKIASLTTSLQTLSTTASALDTSLPPEIIDYVEDGRNPDIYTREFVESAQKLNMLLKGKSEAFGAFGEVLGEELVGGGFARREEVKEVLGREVGWGVEDTAEAEQKVGGEGMKG